MKVLLDTNVLLAMILDELERLPSAMRDHIVHRSTERLVSVAALWEIAIKTRQKKLSIPMRRDELGEALDVLGCRSLPLSSAHCTADVDPWPETNDPFDRIMLAVCSVEGLKIVTLDAKLRDHPFAWRP